LNIASFDRTFVEWETWAQLTPARQTPLAILSALESIEVDGEVR